jgi:hypothetical protein
MRWPLCLVGLLACAPPSATPAPRSVAPSAPEPCDAPPPVAKPAEPVGADPLVGRITDAVARLPSHDWFVKELHVVPGRAAAFALADQLTPFAQCNSAQPIVFAGMKKVLVDEVYSPATVKASGDSVFWDLRGDGSRSVVVEAPLCGFASTEILFGLGGDGEWSRLEGDARPRCALCERPPEATLGNRPLFSFYFTSLMLASGGPHATTSAGVLGIEAWDGERFRADLPALAPLYQRRLDAARAAGKAARARGGKGCNVAAYQAAGDIYVYGRILGATDASAMAEADAVVAGIGTRPCAAAHAESMYGGTSYDWPEIRDRLVEDTASLAVIAKP